MQRTASSLGSSLFYERLLISAMGTVDREDTSYHYEVEIRIIPDADQLVGWLERGDPQRGDEKTVLLPAERPRL
jgi:hypothetical protein